MQILEGTLHSHSWRKRKDGCTRGSANLDPGPSDQCAVRILESDTASSGSSNKEKGA